MLHFNLPTTRERADWGCYGRGVSEQYRLVAIEDDDTIRAWDYVGETYSVHHDLSDAECEEIRRMAVLVRNGKYYTAGGFLIRKDEQAA